MEDVADGLQAGLGQVVGGLDRPHRRGLILNEHQNTPRDTGEGPRNILSRQ